MKADAHRPKPLRHNPRTHPLMRDLIIARVSAGITQPDLAEAIGYEWKSISQMETGARNIYLQRIIDYADYFGYDLVLQKRNS
jgi:DNA-binding XRE family transcriptional regulator